MPLGKNGRPNTSCTKPFSDRHLGKAIGLLCPKASKRPGRSPRTERSSDRSRPNCRGDSAHPLGSLRLVTTRKPYFGDNLEILREHVPTESVDLVYLDPPFTSNQSYTRSPTPDRCCPSTDRIETNQNAPTTWAVLNRLLPQSRTLNASGDFLAVATSRERVKGRNVRFP